MADDDDKGSGIGTVAAVGAGGAVGGLVGHNIGKNRGLRQHLKAEIEAPVEQDAAKLRDHVSKLDEIREKSAKAWAEHEGKLAEWKKAPRADRGPKPKKPGIMHPDKLESAIEKDSRKVVRTGGQDTGWFKGKAATASSEAGKGGAKADKAPGRKSMASHLEEYKGRTSKEAGVGRSTETAIERGSRKGFWQEGQIQGRERLTGWNRLKVWKWPGVVYNKFTSSAAKNAHAHTVYDHNQAVKAAETHADGIGLKGAERQLFVHEATADTRAAMHEAHAVHASKLFKGELPKGVKGKAAGFAVAGVALGALGVYGAKKVFFDGPKKDDMSHVDREMQRRALTQQLAQQGGQQMQ